MCVCLNRCYIFFKWSHSDPTFYLSIPSLQKHYQKVWSRRLDMYILFCLALQHWFSLLYFFFFIIGWIYLWTSNSQALYDIFLLEKKNSKGLDSHVICLNYAPQEVMRRWFFFSLKQHHPPRSPGLESPRYHQCPSIFDTEIPLVASLIHFFHYTYLSQLSPSGCKLGSLGNRI